MQHCQEYETLLKNFLLHYHCMIGNTINAQELLSENRDSAFSLDDIHYWTPAHWAASTNKTECILLLKNIGAVNLTAKCSMTLPLHIACENGHVEVLQVLLDSDCKINSQDNQGETALHKAARSGHTNCVHMLLLAGARTDIRSFSHRNASEVAAISGRFEVSSILNEVSKYTHSMDSNETQKFPDNICKRQLLPEIPDTLLKRRKYTDPVLQIASDMVGNVGAEQMMDAVSCSVLDQAAYINMADVYAEHYSNYADTDLSMRQF